MRTLSTLILTSFALAAVPSSAMKDSLEVLPGSVRQGEALFLRVTDAEVERGEVVWRKETFPLQQDGKHWRAVLPVSPDTPPGRHTLTVTIERGGKYETLSRSIPVSAVRWSIQRLRMAKGTAKLYNFPGARREDALVRAAITTQGRTRLWTGDWSLPSRGRTSTPFGVRRLRNGKPVGRHRGLDVAAPTGTPIRAPAAGRVVLAEAPGRLKKYGGTVVLDHGQGVTSLYMHMSGVSVRKGQQVAKGALLGKIGATGVATGPHLHWAVYVHGDAVEPRFFMGLQKRGIRL